MATYKNDIILIAGSGDFAFEAAKYFSDKNRLNHIILLSKNYKITKSFKNNLSNFDVRDLEKLILFIKKRIISKVLIIGYVQLPPISEIKLSLASKLIISKNFFFNDIHDQYIQGIDFDNNNAVDGIFVEYNKILNQKLGHIQK